MNHDERRRSSRGSIKIFARTANERLDARAAEIIVSSAQMALSARELVFLSRSVPTLTLVFHQAIVSPAGRYNRQATPVFFSLEAKK